MHVSSEDLGCSSCPSNHKNYTIFFLLWSWNTLLLVRADPFGIKTGETDILVSGDREVLKDSLGRTKNGGLVRIKGLTAAKNIVFLIWETEGEW
jgi:hypothetical protein